VGISIVLPRQYLIGKILRKVVIGFCMREKSRSDVANHYFFYANFSMELKLSGALI